MRAWSSSTPRPPDASARAAPSHRPSARPGSRRTPPSAPLVISPSAPAARASARTAPAPPARHPASPARKAASAPKASCASRAPPQKSSSSNTIIGTPNTPRRSASSTIARCSSRPGPSAYSSNAAGSAPSAAMCAFNEGRHVLVHRHHAADLAVAITPWRARPFQPTLLTTATCVRIAIVTDHLAAQDLAMYRAPLVRYPVHEVV